MALAAIDSEPYWWAIENRHGDARFAEGEHTENNILDEVHELNEKDDNGEYFDDDAPYKAVPVYRSPVVAAHEQEPVAWTWHYREKWHVTNDEERARDLAWDGVKVEPLYRHAQPAPERDQVRREHAEWSQATFGNVGPVGPLKHLSKEALEAAEQPGDLSEWADMQFLLWDAQRRAGITDEQITQAMIEKLAVNKQREWPEPKDGEPRLHIKAQPAPERAHKWSYGLVHPENCQCIECRSARINGVTP